MSIKKIVQFIVKCSKKDCKKQLEVNGGNTNDVYARVRKEGWQWKGMQEQYCPEHATRSEPKAKPAKKAKPKKASTKKADKPTRRVAKLIGIDTPAPTE